MSADLAARLQTLEDRAAIQDLVLNYCRGVDRRDYDLLRTLYHDDAIDDHGGHFCGAASDYVDWLASDALPKIRTTNHYVTNHLIALDGNYAEGEVYLAAYHRVPDGVGGWLDLWTGGRYLDKYEKRADGVWRFAYRKIVADWNAVEPTKTSFEGGFSGTDEGQPGRDDPAYSYFKLLGQLG